MYHLKRLRVTGVGIQAAHSSFPILFNNNNINGNNNTYYNDDHYNKSNNYNKNNDK